MKILILATTLLISLAQASPAAFTKSTTAAFSPLLQSQVQDCSRHDCLASCQGFGCISCMLCN